MQGQNRDMVDLIVIAAFLISVLSAIFVVLTGGMQLIFGFREQKLETKKAIDDKLEEAVDKEIKNFQQETTQESSVKRENLSELGFKTHVVINITGDIFDSMILNIYRAISMIITLIVALFVTYYENFTSFILQNIVTFISFGVLDVVLVYLVGINIRRYILLRSAFNSLAEKSTLENARELWMDLKYKKAF